METVAHLLGEKFGTLRQQFHLGAFGRLGEQEGKTRLFGLTDVALLKLAYALRDRDPLTIKRAWAVAGGFLEPLVAEIGAGTHQRQLFAVVPHDGPTEPFQVPAEDLSEAIVETLKTTTSITVVSLTELAEEIAVEWAIAVGAGDDLRRRFVERADQMSEFERGRMAKLLSSAQAKLAGGTKVRVDPTAVTSNGTFVLPGTPDPAPAPNQKPAKVRA